MKIKAIGAVLALFSAVGALTAAPNLNADGASLLAGPVTLDAAMKTVVKIAAPR